MSDMEDEPPNPCPGAGRGASPQGTPARGRAQMMAQPEAPRKPGRGVPQGVARTSSAGSSSQSSRGATTKTVCKPASTKATVRALSGMESGRRSLSGRAMGPSAAAGPRSLSGKPLFQQAEAGSRSLSGRPLGGAPCGPAPAGPRSLSGKPLFPQAEAGPRSLSGRTMGAAPCGPATGTVPRTTTAKKTSTVSVPKSSAGSLSRSSMGAAPRSSTGAAPRTAQGAVSRTTMKTVAKPATGAAPRVSTGATARVSTGATARVSTGATARVSTGATARVSTGATARVSTGAVPRTSTGAVPRTSTGAVPRTSTGAVPRTSTGAVPRTSTGAVPRTSTGAAPRTSIGAVPRTSTGAVPRTSTGKAALAVPKASRTSTLAPPAQQPVYQKKTPQPVTSRYAYVRKTPSATAAAVGLPPPQKKGLTKISTKARDVQQTAAGPQKVTREVIHVIPTPPGTAEGAYALPPLAPGERSMVRTEPPLDPRSPYAGALRVSPREPSPPKSPLGDLSARSPLSREVEANLLAKAQRSPARQVVATGAKVTFVKPPVILVNDVPVSPRSQVISEKTVEKSPGVEKVSRTLVGIEQLSPCAARRIELQMQQLDQTPPPHPTSPPREVVSVKSTVSSHEGQIQTDTVVTYETTQPADNYGLTTEEVEQMVVEESQDVKKSLKWKPIELVASTPTSFQTKKKEHEYTLTSENIKDLQKSIVLPEPGPDEAPNDELQPELMATIMHTEEKGMDMMSEPTTIYTYLFPDVTELGQDVIEINSAAPAPLHDVAVPSHTLPEAFYNTSVNPELEKVILETDGQSKKPSAAGFSDYQEKKSPGQSADQTTTVIMEDIKRKHLKKKDTSLPDAAAAPPLGEEQPPWTEEEQQKQAKELEKTLLDLVGAAPSHGTDAEIRPDSFSVGLPSAEAADYVLHVEPPTYRSKVQLRGSCPPPWFPGYYVAFPEIPEIITLVKYPTVALTAAWKNTQPKAFPDDSFVVL